jgi:hypothetical protein
MKFSLEEIAVALQGFGHPVRLRCIALLEAEHSPSELADLLAGPTLGTVSYHVRMLRTYGLVFEVRTEPRRGALEHYYVRTPLATEVMKVIAPMLGLPRRGPGRPKAGREDALMRALGIMEEEAAA